VCELLPISEAAFLFPRISLERHQPFGGLLDINPGRAYSKRFKYGRCPQSGMKFGDEFEPPLRRALTGWKRIGWEENRKD